MTEGNIKQYSSVDILIITWRLLNTFKLAMTEGNIKQYSSVDILIITWRLLNTFMLDRRQHKAVFFSRYTCINNNMETTEYLYA